MRHELHITRKALQALVVALVPALVIGYALEGTVGALSVLAGSGIIGVNAGLAAISVGWSKRLTYATLVSGYGGWVLRMFGVLVAFSVAAQIPSLHQALFVVSFCASLVLVLF